MNYKTDAKFFKAMADENRLAILKLLQDGEKCGCILLESLNISQSTLSHHINILCDAGIVESCKDGKKTHYFISYEGSQKLQKIVDNYAISEEDYKKYKKCDFCKPE
ncbi:MAG: metalloregulator ArsR/SmtB family transcription factor [Bacilli bacterium]